MENRKTKKYQWKGLQRWHWNDIQLKYQCLLFKLGIEFIHSVEETKCSAFWCGLIERLTDTETLAINLREHREYWHPVSIRIRLIWTHQSSSTTFLPIQTSSTAIVNAVANALLEKWKCDGHPQHPSTQRYAIADWIDAQDSALAWISGKVPSKCTPNFINVALPFLEIFRKSRYFLNRPCSQFGKFHNSRNSI